MKKIGIFGANGKTGLLIVKQAIDKGYTVKAAVRKKESMQQFVDKIEVVEYTFEDENTVKNVVEGCDIIVSAIGSGSYADAAKPTHLYSSSMDKIITAIRDSGVNRILAISSGGTEYDPKSPWYYKYLLRRYFMNSYMDMVKMETLLEASASEIQWTIVRPTYLLDGKSKPYLVEDRKIGKGSFKINRIDVADFIIKESNQNHWVHKYPVLGYD